MATTPAIDMTVVDIGSSTNHGDGRTIVDSMIYALTAATGTDTAVSWVETQGWESICVLVDITSSGTLNIVGSNKATDPGTSDNGIAMTTAVTSDGFATFTTEKIPRWFKVYPSASGGAMTCHVKIRRTAMDSQT